SVAAEGPAGCVERRAEGEAGDQRAARVAGVVQPGDRDAHPAQRRARPHDREPGPRAAAVDVLHAVLGIGGGAVGDRPRFRGEPVVVLPWVPATAIARRVPVMAASVSARRRTGIPRSPAATTSGFDAGMAVETVTASTSSPTLAAEWPMATLTPRARRRSVLADALRSLPVTWCPMAASTVAMAL